MPVNPSNIWRAKFPAALGPNIPRQVITPEGCGLWMTFSSDRLHPPHALDAHVACHRKSKDAVDP